MKEIWRDIVGYEGLYKVSNMGRVKSLAKRVHRGYCNVITEEHMMSLQRCKGYVQVTLSRNGIQKSYRIHRLVALAFLKREAGCNHVDHTDGNKENNCVSNLRWVTHKDNMNNPITKMASKRLCKIRCTSVNGEFTKEYPSLTSASHDLGIPLSSISCILNGTGGMSGQKCGYTFTRL